jgi:hypothetical protein
MRWNSTPSTNTSAGAHRHHVPAVERRFCRVGRGLETDIARQHAHFATFVHVERDLAEVHEVQLLVERDRVSPDGGDGSPLGLPGIEIRGREDDLVAHSPARGVQDFNGGAAGLGGLGQLRPGVRPVPVQVQVPPMSTMPRSTGSLAPPMPPMSSPLMLLVRVMVAFRVWGLASVPISSSPCNRIHSVVSSRSALSAKLSLPSIGQTAQRRRTDVEEHALVSCNGDLVASGWDLPIGQVAGSDQRVC